MPEKQQELTREEKLRFGIILTLRLAQFFLSAFLLRPQAGEEVGTQDWLCAGAGFLLWFDLVSAFQRFIAFEPIREYDGPAFEPW
jgi:hypothetical protein